MSDKRLRALEHTWRETGRSDDGVAYLLERERVLPEYKDALDTYLITDKLIELDPSAWPLVREHLPTYIATRSAEFLDGCVEHAQAHIIRQAEQAQQNPGHCRRIGAPYLHDPVFNLTLAGRMDDVKSLSGQLETRESELVLPIVSAYASIKCFDQARAALDEYFTANSSGIHLLHHHAVAHGRLIRALLLEDEHEQASDLLKLITQRFDDTYLEYPKYVYEAIKGITDRPPLATIEDDVDVNYFDSIRGELALYHLEQGDLERALEIATQLEPSQSTQLLKKISLSYAQRGNVEEAFRTLRLYGEQERVVTGFTNGFDHTIHEFRPVIITSYLKEHTFDEALEFFTKVAPQQYDFAFVNISGTSLSFVFDQELAKSFALHAQWDIVRTLYEDQNTELPYWCLQENNAIADIIYGSEEKKKIFFAEA